MAKKKEMTPAERLAAALVPAAEQPYGIPANWQWVRLGSLVNLLRGVSYKKTDVHLPKQENDCLILRGGNIQEGAITFDSDNVYIDKSLVKKEQFVKANDVVIVASTGSVKVIGRAGIVDKDYSDVAFGAFLLLARPRENICKKFVDFYFQNDLYRNRIKRMVSGVNINNIRAEHITEAPFPLPPLAEQERIVARVEALFAKLDEAEEKIRAALAAFDRRRAALLRAAFTGRLTAAWRTAHGRSLDEWEKSSLKNCLKPQQAQKPGGETFRYIDIDSIDNKRQIVREPKILPTTKAPSRANRKLHENDIVFSLVRPYLKNIAYIDASLADCIASTGFYVCTCNDNLFPRYLYHFLCSDIAIQYSMQFMKGDNSPSIRKDEFVSMTINLPPLDEQREIVRVLDEAFAREAQARAAAEAALIAVPKLRRAVLARAFRGELGTNDPAEPPALSAD